MKKLLLSTLILIATINLKAETPQPTEQTGKATEPFKFELYGFVRNDFTFDSRKSLASVCELFCFIPNDIKLNDKGEDINAVPSSRFVSITSRIGFNVTSPLYGKMRFGAKIEADFCGQANYLTLLRIRQANFTLNWPKHKILVGQTWHPMTASLIPEIVSLNTGAPFGPFSRAPQLKYDAHLGCATLTGAAIYQFQYTSPGPEGNSTAYQVFGGLPEFYIGADFGKDNWKIGAGAEYMQIKPANFIDDTKVNASVQSFATQLYAKYSTQNFDIAAKSIYGQNLAHLLMMSGYAEYGFNGTDPTTIRYAPLTQSSSWLVMGYRTNKPNHNIRTALFAGYMKNLGTDKKITGASYVRGFDNIDQMFRIAPSIKYSFKHLNIGLEYEYTGVYYGSKQPDMTVVNTHLVSNHRAYLIFIYNFNHAFTSSKKK